MLRMSSRSIAELPHQRSFDDLGTPLHDVTFCIIDLETTGGNRNDDMITEIGAVKVRGGEFLGTFQTLVNPGRAIPPQITVLTGLSDVLVSNAPRIEAVLGTLIDFVGDSVIVGHNVGFDVGFLRAACQRADRPPSAAPSSTPSRSLAAWCATRCPTASSARWRRDCGSTTDRATARSTTRSPPPTCCISSSNVPPGSASSASTTWSCCRSSPAIHRPAKLKMTADLPRTPGVYMFRGQRDEILYVGKATNLRQRVRSYFGSDDRRKIGPMLRETQSVTHLDLPDALTAEVIESRLISRLLPRYNRAGTRADKYCYVKLDVDSAWPRLVGGEEPVGDRTPPRPAAVAHDGQPGRRSDPDRRTAATLHGPDGPQLHAARGRVGVQRRPARRGAVSVLRHRRSRPPTPLRSMPPHVRCQATRRLVVDRLRDRMLDLAGRATVRGSRGDTRSVELAARRRAPPPPGRGDCGSAERAEITFGESTWIIDRGRLLDATRTGVRGGPSRSRRRRPPAPASSPASRSTRCSASPGSATSAPNGSWFGAPAPGHSRSATVSLISLR